MSSLEMSHVLPQNLAHRLGVELNIAQALCNRMDREGLLKLAPRNKKK